MNIESVNIENDSEKNPLDKGKIKKIVLDFAKEKGYDIHNPETCKNKCGEWNQQVGLELSQTHGIPTTMKWVKKNNDFLPGDHPAVENGFVFHCFVKLKEHDLFIDVTPRQFDPNSEEVVILSETDIKNQGWIEAD